MSDSYPFNTYSGLLEPKHYKQIGSALWLFLWCISSTTAEVEKEGVTWGIVLGKKPIKINELEHIFGVSDKTIRSWVKTLEKHHYIRVTRAPYGLIFNVKNSKKYSVRSVENYRSSPVENDLSLVRERQNTTNQGEENYRSNKDITEVLVVVVDENTAIQRSSEIEQHFCQRRGKGFSLTPIDFAEVMKMVKENIPVELIKSCIDKSFAEFNPAHKKDEIRSVTYCIPRCYDEWTKMQIASAITSPDMPLSGTVALGESRQGSKHKTNKQQQIDELDEFIREEESRGNNRSSPIIQENQTTLC